MIISILKIKKYIQALFLNKTLYILYTKLFFHHEPSYILGKYK